MNTKKTFEVWRESPKSTKTSQISVELGVKVTLFQKFRSGLDVNPCKN